jgi:hypothetical protein
MQILTDPPLLTTRCGEKFFLDLMSFNGCGEYVGDRLKVMHIVLAERTLASCMRTEHSIGA